MSTTTWNLDTAHSEVTFKVKHMMISNVTGQFKDFSAIVTSEGENFTKGEVSFAAKTTSIDTKNEQRDGHLRSADFFDAEKFPELKFTAKGFTPPTDGGEFDLNGDLTIKGITKPIKLKAEFGGIQNDLYGNVKAGFTINGKFNRKDFGLTWNAALETGGVVVSDEVKITCEIQLAKA